MYLDSYSNIEDNHITLTHQYKLCQAVLSDYQFIESIPKKEKEDAVRKVLNFLIDKHEDISQSSFFLGPNLYKHVTEDFIREFIDYVNWERAQLYFKFSQDFIKNELPVKDWRLISMYQNLSESFIDEFSDKIDWDQVCRTQKLSYNFIKKHHKEVNWEMVTMYQESWFNRINNIK